MMNLPSNDYRSLSRRFDSQLSQAAQVSAALRQLDRAHDLYKAIQHSENELRDAKVNLDAAQVEVVDRQAALTGERRRIVSFSRVCAELCRAFDVPGADAVILANANDEPATASEMADVAERIPDIGPELSKALLTLRRRFVAAETKLLNTNETYQSSRTQFVTSLFALKVATVQGRALLTVEGIYIAPSRGKARKTQPVASPSQLGEAVNNAGEPKAIVIAA